MSYAERLERAALQAPDNIPGWFDEYENPELPRYPSVETLPTHLRFFVRGWTHDPVFDLYSMNEGSSIPIAPAYEGSAKHELTETDIGLLAVFQRNYEEARKKRQQAEKQLQINRYFAWRIYFAETLIKKIDEKHPSVEDIPKGGYFSEQF